MTLALLTAVISVLAGLAAAIAAHARLWVLAPVRAFAVVAVAAAIAVHILPEAIDGAGWWVLVPFVLGFVAPPLVGAVSRAAASGHRRVAAELSYGGVLVHQLGDGLGLGALTSDAHHGHVHWDFVVGLGAHTVPLVAIIALAFAELGGRRAALVRSAGLLAATLAGIALTRLDGAFMADAGPWLNAAVSGLLFHVLLHDADDRDVPRRARPLEALGAAAGAALPWITSGHEHGALTAAIRHGAGEVAIALAPVLVIGGLFATLLAPHQRRSPSSIVALVAGPATALALLAAAYVAAAHDAFTGDEPGVLSPIPEVIGVAAAALLAALALGRIATAGFMTWLGRASGHAHDHGHHQG
jgi:hypothetical protein